MDSDDRSNQCKQAQQLRKIADDRQVKSNITTFNLTGNQQRRHFREWCCRIRIPTRPKRSKTMRCDFDRTKRKLSQQSTTSNIPAIRGHWRCTHDGYKYNTGTVKLDGKPIANLKVVSYATSGMPIDPSSAERLAGAPFVFPHVWHAASVFARKGSTSAESTLSVTGTRSLLKSVMPNGQDIQFRPRQGSKQAPTSGTGATSTHQGFVQF
jgi:hypothetical protein